MVSSHNFSMASESAESEHEYFQKHWQQWLPLFESQFQRYLELALSNKISASGLTRLHDAMRYSSLAGGKRLRALLIYLVYHCCARSRQSDTADLTDGLNLAQINDLAMLRPVDQAALSIELIHTYSLIHDDLPALDDDKLRRGKATCHIEYDEATAILAGDALHSLAFECLSIKTDTTPGLQLELINLLAQASGALGMVGGQAIDIASENLRIDLEQLTTLHRLKTGKLILTAVKMGASVAAADEQQRQALDRYGANIGLAFQVQDDIIDITSSSEQLGKTQGSDQNADKSTFPLLLGLEGATQKAMHYYQDALDSLSIFGAEADALRGLANFFVQRDR